MYVATQVSKPLVKPRSLHLDVSASRTRQHRRAATGCCPSAAPLPRGSQAVAHAQWQGDYFHRQPHMQYVKAIVEEAEEHSAPPWELFFGFLATLLMEEQEEHAKRGAATALTGTRCVA